MTSLGCLGGGNADYCLTGSYATLFQKKSSPRLASGSTQGDAILAPVFLRGQLDAVGQTRILFEVLSAESRVTLSGSGFVLQQSNSHSPGTREKKNIKRNKKHGHRSLDLRV